MNDAHTIAEELEQKLAEVAALSDALVGKIDNLRHPYLRFEALRLDNYITGAREKIATVKNNLK